MHIKPYDLLNSQVVFHYRRKDSGQSHESQGGPQKSIFQPPCPPVTPSIHRCGRQAQAMKGPAAPTSLVQRCTGLQPLPLTSPLRNHAVLSWATWLLSWWGGHLTFTWQQVGRHAHACPPPQSSPLQHQVAPMLKPAVCHQSNDKALWRWCARDFSPPPLYTAPGLMPALAMPQCALLFFAMAATGFLVCHAWKGGMERGGSGRHRGQQWMPNSSCEQIKKTPFSSLPGPWQVQGHDSDCTVVVLSPASPSPLVQPVKSKLVDTQQGVAYADSMSYVHIDMYIK